MDKITPEKRSWVMAQITSRDTAPEKAVRALLHSMGYRFRLQRVDLPGTPDIVLPKFKTALFVHGCFWHRHPGCKRASTPASNTIFWNTKFARTVKRDIKNQKALEALGWQVMTIWECELRDVTSLQGRLKNFLAHSNETMNAADNSNPSETLCPAPQNSVLSSPRPKLLEFFAGSGLVSHAIAPFFDVIWANDVCTKKAAVFIANHEADIFHSRSITEICGASLPTAALSWASFPCQDLSLAGNGEGIRAKRSGLVWEWLRVMDEMPHRPPILTAENVVGLVSADGGRHYRELHKALAKRGYRVGAMLLDAAHWLPQSRPRIFVVAAHQTIDIPSSLYTDRPTWAHSSAIQKAADGLCGWVWWNLPKPRARALTLSQIVDFDIPCHSEATSKKNLDMVPETHKRQLKESGLSVVPGYKRIRQGRQVLELRFDDVAGCLRTPSGGSSRQYLVIEHGKTWRTRILSLREAANLMGAPESFQLPGSFNDGYKAMGDAVAAPVAAYLAKHLLSPLAAASE